MVYLLCLFCVVMVVAVVKVLDLPDGFLIDMCSVYTSTVIYVHQTYNL